MAIYTAPVVGNRVYLGDLSSTVKALEGDDCDQSDRAWVIIRQATEGDNRRISEMSAETRTVWKEASTEQVRRLNQADVRAKQVYLTLTDAGNIYANPETKEPLFVFENGKLAMPESRFQPLYDSLHPSVVTAVMLAIWQVNPMWDWRVDQEIKCPHCKAQFPVLEEHLVPLVGMAELSVQTDS